MVGSPLDFALFSVMLTYVILTLVYCLGALHNERSDRSILFWKSLPVSDVTTVIAKASIPILILPLITFAVLVVTQGIMLLAGGAVLLSRGAGGAAPWVHTPILPLWAAMLYHLLTVHALYYAPIYAWLLLVSAWARRAVILWASLPVAAILIVEKLVFNTSVFAGMLLSRLGGGPGAISYPPSNGMPIQVPTLANLGAFLASPGLWIGLAVGALLLAAAVRVRRYQGPI
jgi:ABC-2 type transport system permease protein